MQDGFWKEAKNKDITRQKVLNSFQSLKPKISLFLPGIDIACIKKIYDAGITTKDMIFYIVERDENIMLSIKQKIKQLSEQLFNQCLFFTCELSQVKFKHKVEFAFIDLMGNLTSDLSQWIRKNYLPSCSDSNITFFTLLKAYRNNNFMKKWQVFMNKNYKRQFSKQLESQTNDFDFEQSNLYDSIIPCTLYLFDGFYIERGVDFTCSEIFQYKDRKIDSRGIDMIFFSVKMLNIPVPDNSSPDIKHLDFGSVDWLSERSLAMAKSSKSAKKVVLSSDDRKYLERQIAAYKAVSTRYRNLGLPAKAAVATRQANQLSKKLG